MDLTTPILLVLKISMMFSVLALGLEASADDETYLSGALVNWDTRCYQ